MAVQSHIEQRFVDEFRIEFQSVPDGNKLCRLLRRRPFHVVSKNERRFL